MTAPHHQPAPRDAGPVDWRSRLDRANAELRELELARLRGELLPAGEVVLAWEQRLGAFKAKILAIPSKLGARFGDAVEEALTTALHEALLELSGAAIDELRLLRRTARRSIPA